ncbi:hypothetical protein R3P38DRAFT_2946797 [Favolaschia claudopus]|uniref:Large ribosomal subunit protein mL40 n=1 Tax=Favolaschia claudopus TaxID=2862362 RepID=A0AAW0BJ52_9AGAR
MASSLLAWSRARPISLTPAHVRQYAKPADANAGDARLILIRRALYPGNIRNRASPTGTWRPDVRQTIQRAIPSVQAHHTIERAWLLHRRLVRKRREAELARKFECMKGAMNELKRVDSRLYSEANKVEDPRARSKVEMEKMKQLPALEARAFDARIRGLFPREMRIPAETPSKNGWNYEWKPIERPL